MSTIIIARYNENIDWLLKYQDFNVIIYNKGSFIANKRLGEIITLPNVGRESHTWLYHIVSNYQNLDEVNIFLQGRIDDLGVLAYQDLYKYQNECIRKGFSVRRFGILGPFHWVKYLGLEKNSKYKDQLTNKSLKEPEISFKELAQTFIPKIPLFTITNYGGCFAVSKELIKQHKVSLYRELLDILSANDNPLEGHYMERLWCYLFTKNKYLAKGFRDVLLTNYEKLISRKL
ncbi:DUF3431 domain-containing protein [Prochlorococcus sp. AH-716-N03]|nr:DUF3431 domain-containing protein [Prochlorococcus sp. AH-716-N03]